MPKVGYRDIAVAIAAKKGMTVEDAEKYVETFFSVIEEYLIPEKIVKVKGLGTFKLIDVRDRESVDVNTGDRMVIDGHAKVSFTPDASLKEMVNKPFSQFETVVLNDAVDFEKEGVGLHEDVTDSSPASNTETTVENKEQPQEITSTQHDTSSNLFENVEVRSEKVVHKENGELLPVVEPKQNLEKDVVDVVAESRETQIEEETSVDDADTIESTDCENESKDMKHTPRSKSFIMPVLIILGIIVVFLCGYLIGENRYDTMPVTVISPSSQAPRNITVKSSKTSVKQKAKDTVSVRKSETKSIVPKTEPAEINKPEEKHKPETAEVRQKTALPASSGSKQLNSARRFVETGAYEITGTEQTVKVKAGQSIKSIARHYLGEGMECYIQLYNGKMEVNEGETINIPKLKLKKKARNKKDS